MNYTTLALSMLFVSWSLVAQEPSLPEEIKQSTSVISAQELKIIHVFAGFFSIIQHHCPIYDPLFIEEGIYNPDEYPHCQEVCAILLDYLNGEPLAFERLKKFIEEHASRQ